MKIPRCDQEGLKGYYFLAAAWRGNWGGKESSLLSFFFTKTERGRRKKD